MKAVSTQPPERVAQAVESPAHPPVSNKLLVPNEQVFCRMLLWHNSKHMV